MSQTDTKCVLVSALLGAFTVYANQCQENQFPSTKDASLCCPYCPKGMFVSEECLKLAPALYTGVSCKPCRSCEEIGHTTVENCTAFSDTKCGPKNYDNMPLFTLHGASVVIAAAVILFVLVAACSCHKISTTGHNPAGKPFHTEDAETV